jgi:hypothetical protein
MSPQLIELCKPNPYGAEHCYHKQGTSVQRDFPDVIFVQEVCCWCRNTRETRHGMHLPVRG